MDNKIVNDKLLTHELQLGEQLNKCVHASRRYDFGLMLAMLADDVREQSQFLLPEHQEPSTEVTNELLRNRFKLPDEAPLSLKSIDDINQFSQADSIEKNQISDIHLLDCLKPKALVFRDDKNHINTEIMTNTSIHCQTRHKTNKGLAGEQEKLTSRLAFNAKEWLSSIQTTLVKEPLVKAHA